MSEMPETHRVHGEPWEAQAVSVEADEVTMVDNPHIDRADYEQDLMHFNTLGRVAEVPPA